MAGASTPAFPALWPITRPETHGLFDACDDPPRERGFLERLSGTSHERPHPRGQALIQTNPQHPSLQFKKIGERQDEEIWSARVTLKYRALAIKLAGEYLWFWIGEHNVYDAILT